MSDLRTIPIDDLRRRSDARTYGADEVAALADSIDEIGLLNPPTVRSLAGGGFEVIAGSHRLAACDSLGWPEIPCRVVDLDETRAKLAMIDENLIRAELVGIERDRQIAERKTIYETLHPETRNGENQHTRVRQVGEPSSADRFTTETAALTGQSERTIQRSAERGAKVAPEAAAVISGTRLDTGLYADRIKDLPPDEQVETVRRDLAAPPKPRQSQQRTSQNTVAVPSERMDPARAYKRFLGAAYDIGELIAADIAAGLPAPKDRAALVSHVRVLLDILSELDALLQDGVR